MLNIFTNKTKNKYLSKIASHDTYGRDGYRNIGNLKSFKLLVDIGHESLPLRTQIVKDFEKVSSLFPKLKGEITLTITKLPEGCNVLGTYNPLAKTITLFYTGCEMKSVFFHEMAHAIIDIYLLKDELSSLDMQYANEYDTSLYSSTNHEEFFCELFSNYYTLDKHDNRYITANKLLVEFFDNKKSNM